MSICLLLCPLAYLSKSSAVAGTGDRVRAKWAEKWGGVAVPLSVHRELGRHLTQCRLGRGHVAARGILIKLIYPSNHLATIDQRYRQTGQRSDSIGRTVLQTVAQKLHVQTSRNFSVTCGRCSVLFG